jgi:hypothetical protein
MRHASLPDDPVPFFQRQFAKSRIRNNDDIIAKDRFGQKNNLKQDNVSR